MEELSKIYHSLFQYVFISTDINIEPQIRSFEGFEEGFNYLMKNHFSVEILTEKNKNKFVQKIKQKNYSENNYSVNDEIDSTQLNKLISNTGTYQIIPLYLPSKANHYKATNAYIDDLGRIKELERNSRASRICSTDIRGDCFISSTFDNEEIFKRIDFTLKDYFELLENPPSAINRWDQSKLLEKINNNTQMIDPMKKQNSTSPTTCGNCGKTKDDINKKLLACSRCHRTKYCSVFCQKSDWKYHKRICH